MGVEAEEVQRLLRGAGLRVTPGRVAVYRVLAEARAPLTHNDLVEATKPLRLDRATVYRNLVSLAEAGLLTRTDLGDHVWRFEIPRSHEDSHPAHPHFVCVTCGDVQCLDGLELKLPSAARGPRALAEREVEVQVRGVCDDCT